MRALASQASPDPQVQFSILPLKVPPQAPVCLHPKSFAPTVDPPLPKECERAVQLVNVPLAVPPPPPPPPPPNEKSPPTQPVNVPLAVPSSPQKEYRVPVQFVKVPLATPLSPKV